MIGQINLATAPAPTVRGARIFKNAIIHSSRCSQSLDWAYTSPRVEVCAKETSPDEQSNGNAANCCGTGWVVQRNLDEHLAWQFCHSSRTGCGSCWWQRPDALVPPRAMPEASQV